MSGEVVVLPTGAKVSFIRSALERERGMRERVLKGENRTRGVSEMNQCLKYLADIGLELKT